MQFAQVLQPRNSHFGRRCVALCCAVHKGSNGFGVKHFSFASRTCFAVNMTSERRYETGCDEKSRRDELTVRRRGFNEEMKRQTEKRQQNDARTLRVLDTISCSRVQNSAARSGSGFYMEAHSKSDIKHHTNTHTHTHTHTYKHKHKQTTMHWSKTGAYLRSLVTLHQQQQSVNAGRYMLVIACMRQLLC